MLSVLEYVHSKGIVHRDLKPANIFLEPNPSGEIVVRVMDFGIAKVLDKSRTRTAMMMGTLAYMSPEQIRSPKEVDGRADLFAAGAILYEMLTGKPAFDGDTELDIQSRITQGQFTPLRENISEDLDDLPKHLEAAIKRALSVEPDERFATASKFSAALAAPASSPAVATTPSPTPSFDSVDFNGKNTVISGTLSSTTRSEAKVALEQRGARVTGGSRASFTSTMATAGPIS